MTPLIYTEEYDNEESPSDPPSAEPTPEPRISSGKPTKEPTLKTDYDALSEPYAPTGEGNMENIAPKDIVR